MGRPLRISLARVENFGNKQKEARLIMATGHPFPPPPVLGWSLGAADGPFGCALNFFATSLEQGGWSRSRLSNTTKRAPPVATPWEI